MHWDHGEETTACKTLAVCLTHHFFNSVLLDYFLKHSGDRDSKEQLSLAKAGSFSHIGSIFHGSSSKLYAKPKKTAWNKSIQERLSTEYFTSLCIDSLAPVSGTYWEQVGRAQHQGDKGGKILSAAQGARISLPGKASYTYTQPGRTRSFTHLLALTGASRLLASVRVQAAQMDCHGHPLCV